MGVLSNWMSKKGTHAEKKGKKTAKAKKSKLGMSGSSKKSKGSKKKYKKKSPLSFTSLEPFVDSLFGENGYTIQHQGEEYGVVLVLPFSEVGGIRGDSKTDRHNENKGRFVTAVNKGDFEVYFDEKQDEAEQLVILVNTDSIDTLSDFTILEDVDFRWAYFSRDGELIETDYVSSLDELVEHRDDVESYIESVFTEEEEDVSSSDDAVELESNNDSDALSELEELSGLDDLSINESTVNMTGSTTVESKSSETTVNEEQNVEEPDFSELGDLPLVEDELDDDSELGPVVDSNQESIDDDEPVDVDEGDTQDSGQDVYDDDYDETLMHDAEHVDAEAVKLLVDQILFKGDLDLELPVNRFRESYHQENDGYLIPYFEEDGSWLTTEANRLIHEANDDINRRLQHDEDMLHSTYIRLLNDLAISVKNQFDLKGDGAYAAEFEAIVDHRDSKRNEVAKEYAEYEELENRAYEKRKEEKGDEAKRNAMNTYDQQNRDRHARHLDEHRLLMEKNVEAGFNREVIDLKARRKEQALAHFDAGVSEILASIGTYYMSIRKAQKTYADEWGDKLLQFLDDNRAEDIARVDAMQRQLDNDERITRLQTESEAQIQRLTQEFDSQVQLIKTASENDLAQAQSRIKSLEDEKLRLDKEREGLVTRTSKEYHDLMEKHQVVVQELAAAKTKAALAEVQQSQLNQRDREIDDWKRQVELISQSNDKNKVAFFCVAVVAVVAALLVGMIAGAQLF